MAFIIRKASPADVTGVIALLREFAEYENLSNFCEITEEKLADAVFGENAFVECLVALDAGRLVGYALVFRSFASFRGQKGMFLEDIFIKPEYRRSGLGELMLKEVADLARLRGCERIDLMVLDWNTPALKFYEKHGATLNEGELHMKFVDRSFEKLSL